ncbi:winged helix-turn-helix domain-containing protein [Nocardia fusca]|uniref:winged helix-turn-helix domain-containing protein n=1 Tax=Nocardia fusca TaxID=941183 RepID=UPI000A011E31|nr:helix-turn-helix domain-containing protein [Nocardia fusca]
MSTAVVSSCACAGGIPLAHPLRQRILRALAENGPATSTALGAPLGENTGATSYHLRQLAQHGFIEEAPELAKGNERWWRSPPKDQCMQRILCN